MLRGPEHSFTGHPKTPGNDFDKIMSKLGFNALSENALSVYRDELRETWTQFSLPPNGSEDRKHGRPAGDEYFWASWWRSHQLLACSRSNHERGSEVRLSSTGSR